MGALSGSGRARASASRFVARSSGGFVRDRRGATAVEFAFLALPFCLLVFAILETSLAFTAELSMQRATTHVARLVRTGQATNGGMTGEDLRRGVCRAVPLPIDCARLKIDLRAYSDFAEIASTHLVSNGVLNTADLRFEAARRGDVMALRVFYPWPIHVDLVRKYLTGGDGETRLIAATNVFKVEPFK